MKEFNKFIFCCGAQRAGTTWFFQQLCGLKQFDFPPRKELRYFDALQRDDFQQIQRERLAEFSRAISTSVDSCIKNNKPIDTSMGYLKWFAKYCITSRRQMSDQWYLSLFDDVDASKWTGDFSPDYSLLNEDGVRHMKKVVPAAKILFILRNPVDRFWSGCLYPLRFRKNITEKEIYNFVDKQLENDLHFRFSDYRRIISVFENIFNQKVFTLFHDDIRLNPHGMLKSFFDFIHEDFDSSKFTELKKSVNRSPKVKRKEEYTVLITKKLLDNLMWLSDTYGGHASRWLEDAKQLLSGKSNAVKPLLQRSKEMKRPINLLDVAEIDLQLGLYKEAFSTFKLAMNSMPFQSRAIVGAAKAGIKLKRYSYVERLCEEALLRFPLVFNIYAEYFQSIEAQKNWTKALIVLEDMKKKFPQFPYAWRKIAEVQLKLGNYELADSSLKEAIKLFPENINAFLDFAKLPLCANDQKIWEESLLRYEMLCKKFDSSYSVYKNILSSCYIAVRKSHNSERSLQTYRFLFDCFLGHFNIENGVASREKLAVYISNYLTFDFILPVIKCLPTDCIDVIIGDSCKKAVDVERIKEYTILYGDDKVTNYGYVIVDQLYAGRLGKYNCRLIGYIHSTDNAIPPHFLENLSLAIVASKNQMVSGVIPLDALSECYSLPASDCKCEVCYTGPYHLGDFLKKSHDRAMLRAELAKELNICIPENKPLIFILEDEVCLINQIAYAANKMAHYATVIYKSLLKPEDPRLTKFSSNIHLVRGPLAPNLLRFSADYICCGYMSGSFTTSVMLGQNVLPYFSRFVQRARMSSYVPYENIVPKQDSLFLSAKNIIYSKFKSAGKLLDLVDAASMEKAILGTEYRDWYQANLPEIQKEAFGDYMLEGSPQKTAEYIMRFVKDGTLGKDCSAIYLKEKYFKA